MTAMAALARKLLPLDRCCWLFAISVAAIFLGGCKSDAQPQAPPAPEVSVVEVKPTPVTVYNEYVAQTQAPDTIEIRARSPVCSSGSFRRRRESQERRPALRHRSSGLSRLSWSRPRRIWRRRRRTLVNASGDPARYDRLVGRGSGQPAGLRQRGDAGARQHRHRGGSKGAAAQRRPEPGVYEHSCTARRLHERSLVKAGSLITAQQTLLTRCIRAIRCGCYSRSARIKPAGVAKGLKIAGELRRTDAVSHPARRRYRLPLPRTSQLRRCHDRSEERNAPGPHLGAQSRSLAAAGLASCA